MDDLSALESAARDLLAPEGSGLILTEWVLVGCVLPVEGGRTSEATYDVRSPTHMLHHHVVGLLAEGQDEVSLTPEDD